jgi:hypothetical protein
MFISSVEALQISLKSYKAIFFGFRCPSSTSSLLTYLIK